MTCQPEQVTAYVDGTLDAPTREEVETHLAECGSCRAQADEENEIRERLRALPPVPLPSGLELDVRRRLRAARPARLSSRLRVLLPLAATVVAALAWVRGAAPFMAWELARDHAHCYGLAKLPAQVWSDDPGVVTSWFSTRGSAMPYLPARVGALELVGARRCPLLDRSVAHLYYMGDDARVSLFVVSGNVRFHAPYTARSRGLSVRLLRVGGSVVGLVGKRDEDVAAFQDAFTTIVASNETHP
jgi:anti-sigma factor RsiW